MINEFLQDELLHEGKFSSVYDNALFAVATITSVDFKFSRVNDTFCKLLEYDRSELIGVRGIADITHPDDIKKSKELLTKLINNEVQQAKIEKCYVTKSGKYIDVIVFVRGFYGKDGKYIGSTGSVLDITYLKQTEFELLEHKENLEKLVIQRTEDLSKTNDLLMQANEELKCAKEQAEVSNHTKSMCLTNMSHEIRTPLNAITGFVQLLFKTELNEQQKDHLSKIIYSADVLQALLADILDLGKIEAGKLNIEYKPFEVRKIFEKSLHIFDAEVKSKSLRLSYEIDPDLPKYLIGDPIRIRQVFINLIGNAVKFTDEGSIHVELTALQCNTQSCTLECTVTDTGIGIAQEDYASLFEMFAQVDSSFVREKGGTGLGLSISKQLIEAMGGTIDVESEFGSGSTFSFELPLDIALASPIIDNQQSLQNITFKELKILLVEDNLHNREIVRSLLLSMGITVDEAESGQQALEMIRSYPYDMVFMDIQMPVMDGITAMHILKEEGFTLPVVAFSAHASALEREKSLNAGMIAHLNKPFKFAKVKQLLLKYFPQKASRVIMTNDEQTPCWIDDVEAIPGITLHEEMCHYWKDQKSFLVSFHKYIHSLKNDAEKLFNILENKNDSEAKKLLHKLKGSSKFYGAISLFNAIEVLEDNIDFTQPNVFTQELQKFTDAVSQLAHTIS